VIGSIAAACHAVSRGAAQILRVHDVLETRQAVDVLAAIMESG
jgi:dihydropteroate synthase